MVLRAGPLETWQLRVSEVLTLAVRPSSAPCGNHNGSQYTVQGVFVCLLAC